MSMLNPLPTLYIHRYLLGQLVRREVLARYRGSSLGIGWSLLHPLLLLFVFTLVFGSVFGGRWGSGGESKSGFEMALFIYCGLAVFLPFSEVVSGAPRLLLANQHFVRKIVFPTEILPVVSLIAASIHGITQITILIAGTILAGHLHATVLLVPLVLLPAWLMTLGLAWFLAAAGAYVRDLAHGVPILTQLLMFMLPICYPNYAGPDILQRINGINPLALAMEDLRRTLLNGEPPLWTIWFTMLAVGATCAVFGYAFFARCHEEFADVL
ncbi:MAG: ABC transporter permease [Candidatus Accumulibacter sp.]|uniref:ABC transporter permease n=1 Tax=Accumulibacter sp. TaxID=2053492 RepID=UPI001ACF267B|nr:ABC transporter permease [Accumulibacter sp.]MBN8517269.1 ABC transporter permease [Accumulibacter sp.]MBO3712564.1 ABC transporter permease [Accumulibacter sp.]